MNIHILPYWGQEHKARFVHPYLYDQDVKMVCAHPVFSDCSCSLNQTNVLAVAAGYFSSKECIRDFFSTLFLSHPLEKEMDEHIFCFLPKIAVKWAVEFLLSLNLHPVSGKPISSRWEYEYLFFPYTLSDEATQKEIAAASCFIYHPRSEAFIFTPDQFFVFDFSGNRKKSSSFRLYEEEVDGKFFIAT